jgi:hypothetical protein
LKTGVVAPAGIDRDSFGLIYSLAAGAGIGNSIRTALFRLELSASRRTATSARQI